MPRSKWLSGAATAALVLVPTLTVPTLPAASAATSPDPAAKPGVVMAALMADIDAVERKMVALAEAIPEETYDWRPGEGVRSVREVLMHVAADNYFIPSVGGVAMPESTGLVAGDFESVGAFEARPVTQAEAVAELKASFRHLDEAMSAVEDAELGETIQLFGHDATALNLWVLTTTHLHEHLGQLIAYARTNGVVPPWSRD